MRHGTPVLVLLALLALPLASTANETMDSVYLPLWSIRRVIRANDATLDLGVRTRIPKATVTVDVALNGTTVDSVALAGPFSAPGPFFSYDGMLDLTAYGLRAGDRLALTATVTDGQRTLSRSVMVRVHEANGGVIIVPPGGGGGGTPTQP